MPMHQFRIFGVVENIDRDALVFAKAKERAGRRAIVRNGLHGFMRGDFDFDRSDVQRGVSDGIAGGGLGAERVGQSQTQSCSQHSQEFSAKHRASVCGPVNENQNGV